MGLFLALIVLGSAGSVGGTMWSTTKNNNKHQTSIKQNIEVKENEIGGERNSRSRKQEELQRREIEQKYEENKTE